MGLIRVHRIDYFADGLVFARLHSRNWVVALLLALGNWLIGDA